MSTEPTTRKPAPGGSHAISLGQDLRYAVRRLRKKPGFTLTAILSLAIGVGANAAIFSLVNALLIRDVPLKNPEELVEVYMTTPDFSYNVFSYPDYYDFLDGTQEIFSGVMGAKLILGQVDRDGQVETMPGEAVTGNYFHLLGIDMALGRPLLPEDDVAPGAHPVVVLGHSYWQSAYGADPDVIGQTMRLSGRSYSIIGVAPESYPGNLRAIAPAFYASSMMSNVIQGNDYDELQARGNHSLFLKARLRPGVTLAQAQATVDGLALHLREQDLEDFDPQAGFLLVPTDDVILYPPIDRFVRAASWLLTVVVGLVLLMACTNLASFLLAQAVDRRKEIALRLALGATRQNLISQLLTESVLLAVAGGTAGLAVAVLLLRTLQNADLPLPLPVTLDLSLDLNVLAFTAGVTLLAGIVLGLAPAIQSTKPDLAATLKDEGAGGGQPGKLTLRNALIGAQVAASTVLLVGAGLFLRSLQEVQSVDPGFGREPSAIMTLMVPATRFDEQAGRRYVSDLTERISQVPGTKDVGVISNLHLNTLSTNTTGFNIDGVEPPEGREVHQADTAIVDPGFFAAAGVRIVRGRNFDDHDTPDVPRVVIISEALAERFWPGKDPLGRMLRSDTDSLVVGVASDTKVRTLGEAPRPFVYRPYSQSYTSFLAIVASTSRDADSMAVDMLAAAYDFDPDLWVWETKTMERHLGVVLLPARLSALLLGTFAVLAIGLAAIGLYGIVSYAVSQRTREIGIRMSIGADTASVVRLLMTTGLRPVLFGSVAGLALALLVSRFLSSLLFGVGTLDPFTFAAVTGILVLTALLAALLPALRAARVNPVTALRFE